VGPEALKEEYGSDRVLVLEPAGGMLENLAAGLEALSGFSRVLVVTGDIPLLTAEIVEEFIRLCGDAEAEVYYPIIPREAVETRYPGVQRTYVRLREGSFTGGNVGLVDPRALKRSLERAGDFVRLRKKPFRLALVVGPGFFCRFLLGRLSVKNVERRMCRLLGFSGRAVIADLPEIGVDVDKPADLAAVKAILGK
jgi:CTP:molybdopterin cytidylyltransferase MocA